MNIQEAKKQVKAIVQNAVEKRVSELKETDAFKRLQEVVSAFESDCYCKGSSRQLDEFGTLVGVMELRLDDFSEEETEVFDALLEELSDIIHFSQNQYSQGRHEWTMSQCLGYPIIIKDAERRGDHVIYSEENKKLRFTSDQIKSEEHALLLIELCMRDAGEFPNIVRVNRYGWVTEEVSTGLGNLSDKEIQERLEKIEAEESEE